MAKPVLLTVDDDLDVLRAVERDLRKRYTANYRVVRANSGAQALEVLQTLKLQNEPVALLLVDQRMPQMGGVDFLEQAIPLFPDAKRVLLTAYADTDAAIKAINQVRIDYYLLKPWDPPEQSLYPILDDLLDDWQAAYRPTFQGVRIVGHRWLAEGYQLKNLLARNHVPYQWLDIETSNEARQLLRAANIDEHALPLVLLADGTKLVQPTIRDVAARVGLQTQAQNPFYDLIIVGGGPAGLAAAVYGASEGLCTLLIEKEAPGGQAGTSSRIENYLGFPSGLSGDALARRAVDQARRFGVEILAPQTVTGLRVDGQYRFVRLGDGTEVSCHALLIATGVTWRKLGVPGIDRFQDRGLYYGAAVTEAMSCRDENVFVIGAGNSAGQAALYLADYAANVTMLVRGDSLAKSMSQYLVDRIESAANIDVRLNTEVSAVDGNDHLESVTVLNNATGATETLPGTAIFSFIGAAPGTDWLQGIVERDERGFLLSGPDLMQSGKYPPGWQQDRAPFLLETNVPGVFVAGDVRRGSVKRVASGVGEGSIAVQFIHQYLSAVR
ncbi:MAG TPA: FAD-dependent oxidoreductase [Herpetosiphonaceae bacterium]